MKRELIYSIASTVSLFVTAGTTQAELIAYWPFDEGMGEVASDVVGGFDGQITGGSWLMPGKEGASAFAGTGADEINCGPQAVPQTEDLTLAWWMIDNHPEYGTIMDKSITGSGYGYNILVRGRGEDSPLRFRIGGWQSYGGWGEECRLPENAYNDGEWVHIVCTYDSVTDTASIYVNGSLPENGALNPKTGIAGDGGYCEGVNNVDAPLTIRGGEETFDGTLDEVAIWDHALTPEEVMTVYTSGRLGLEGGLPTFAITALDYSSDDQLLTLSWNSREGETYTVKYSRDLSNWDGDLDDGVAADAGDTTTRTFDLSGAQLEGATTSTLESKNSHSSCNEATPRSAQHHLAPDQVDQRLRKALIEPHHVECPQCGRIPICPLRDFGGGSY